MSLLAYGQGLLAGDFEDGLVPWGVAHPWFALADIDSLSESSGSGDEEFGADVFFSTLAAEAPKDCVEDEKNRRRAVSKELHWDSPPESPSAVAVHLPSSVLQIVLTATKADVVVVGAMQRSSSCVLEHLLHVPREFEVPDILEIDANSFLTCPRGIVISVTDGLDVPVQFEVGLGGRPQAVIASQFSLNGYQGLVYGLWRNAADIPSTAEDVFRDAVVSLPSLLSNRINAKKYENLGRRFDAILKMMPQAVVFVDDATLEVVVNPAAAELLGLPSHGEVEPGKVAQAMQRISLNSGTRTDPQDMKGATSGKEDALYIKEEWVLTSPRRVLQVGSYLVSSHAAHGRLWIYDDVTAERDAQEAILAANKGKSQFLAMMSHELRTPMTGVLGMLGLLSVTELDSQQQEHVKMMQDSADGLMRVLNNILDYCKIEAGRLSLEEIDFSLTEVLEQVVTLQKERLPDDRIQLRLIGPTTSKRTAVRGDPSRIKQILSNLVNNAIKFTEKGCVTISWKFLELSVASSSVPSNGKVQLPAKSGTAGKKAFLRSLSMRRSGSASNLQEQGIGRGGDKKHLWLEVNVVDTGIGMSNEQLQSLFAGSHARIIKGDSSGAGLGLEICDGLLSLMGGAIRVESERNSGTTVTFVVPLRPGEELEELSKSTDVAAPKPSARPLTKVPSSSNLSQLSINVLVAEDNRVNQMLIRRLFLQRSGHNVELVGNGKLAVEAVQNKTYDLVLMDLQMPVLDGLSATKAIRALQPPKCSIPIYALSADALTPESGPMEETGLTGYLSKPIVWDRVSEVLEKVGAQKQAAMQSSEI